MSKLKLSITLFLIAVILVLVLQNTEVVEIRLLFWTVRMSRVLLIVVTALIGFATGHLVTQLRSSRKPGPPAG